MWCWGFGPALRRTFSYLKCTKMQDFGQRSSFFSVVRPQIPGAGGGLTLSLTVPHLSAYVLTSRHSLDFTFNRLCMKLLKAGSIDVVAMKLWTLEERRNRQDLIEVFKMCSGLSRLKLNEFFFTLADNTRGIRGHSRKLVKFRCTRDCCKYFFK